MNSPANDPSHAAVKPAIAPRAADTLDVDPAVSNASGDTTGTPHSALQAAQLLADGTGQLGDYRLLRLLGQGGMGMVFEAHDLKLDRRVAIKVLRSEESDPTLSRRFLQEARLAASLSSDRVVTIFQVGEQAGVQFIAMELLAGETLESKLDRERTLPLTETLRIAREVAEGLEVAHEHHLIHRDIKPANVWLKARQTNEPYSHVKLLDFGIAKPLVLDAKHSAGLTIDGRVVGTPNYMSPEQAQGDVVDERTDLFSLGCLIQAMLTGRAPFERSSAWHTLAAVIEEEPHDLSQAAPNVPQPVADLVRQLLRKDRTQRPATARQVVETLRRLEQGATDPVHRNPDLAQSAMFNRPQLAGRKRRVRWEACVGGAVVVAAALFGAWGAWHRLNQGDVNETRTAAAETLLPESSDASNNDTGPSDTDPNDAGPSRPDANGAANNNDNSDPQPTPASPDLPPIKVGILHSLTGSLAVTERPIVDACVFAIEELNAQGGLLGGRPIEAVIRDGRSNEHVFAEQAEKLLVDEQVVAIFGCWRSTCRKTVEQVCAQHNRLLYYPTTYEGLEESPNVVYLGGVPNQQVLPALKWSFAFLNKRKYYLVGMDGIYARSVAAIVKDELAALGGRVVGEKYDARTSAEFDQLVKDASDSGADIILNLLIGTRNNELFDSLADAGISSDDLPVLSFCVTEEELHTMTVPAEHLTGNYSVAGYFQSLPGDNNASFVERFRERFGARRVVNDPMVNAYTGLYAWAMSVYDANSTETAEVLPNLIHQKVDSAAGPFEIDEDHHAVRNAVIGRVTPELEFEIVWTSPKPIAPHPFPLSRTRDQWQKFQRDLYQGWNDNCGRMSVARDPRTSQARSM